jgi:hypothetical protein
MCTSHDQQDSNPFRSLWTHFSGEKLTVALTVRGLGNETRRWARGVLFNTSESRDQSEVSPHEISPSQDIPPPNEIQPSHADPIGCPMPDRSGHFENTEDHLETSITPRGCTSEFSVALRFGSDMSLPITKCFVSLHAHLDSRPQRDSSPCRIVERAETKEGTELRQF